VSSSRDVHRCDPEAIFRLVEGDLEPEREQALRQHMRACPWCRERYERERGLSSSLRSLGSRETARTPSIACEVAMALPTRSWRARLLWSTIAAGLFFLALLALELSGVGPVALTMEILGLSWGMAAGLADVVRILFAAAGSFFLIALAIGALIDLGIAVGLVLFRRSRRTQNA
jgi:anti-sigma factor RsiW